jgi:signal transduction protein with GAF and PtsI domain
MSFAVFFVQLSLLLCEIDLVLCGENDLSQFAAAVFFLQR